MIKIENLSKYYNNFKVLNSINLEVKKSEVVAVLGSSGCGKSTLLRCINGLENFDEGNLYINNTMVTEVNHKKLRSKISTVFQHFNLFNNLSIIENIALAPRLVHGQSEEYSYENARKLIKAVGMSSKENKMPSEISGGQKQRVAIARALAINPELILFDEPTSALDPEVVKEVLDLIMEFLSTGLTSIIVTHQLKFAQKIADKILFMDKGRVEEFTPTEIFFKNPKSTRAKEFLRNFEE